MDKDAAAIRERALEAQYACAHDEWIESEDAALWDWVVGDGAEYSNHSLGARVHHLATFASSKDRHMCT